MQVHQIINILHQYKVLGEQDSEGMWSFVNIPGISIEVFESLDVNLIVFSFEKEGYFDLTIKLPFGLKEPEVKKVIRKALSFIQSHSAELL